MKYLIALFLLVSPGFACEHRSSFLHKTPDFKLLFWGLSSQGTLVEIYQNNKSRAWFASVTYKLLSGVLEGDGMFVNRVQNGQ